MLPNQWRKQKQKLKNSSFPADTRLKSSAVFVLFALFAIASAGEVKIFTQNLVFLVCVCIQCRFCLTTRFHSCRP